MLKSQTFLLRSLIAIIGLAFSWSYGHESTARPTYAIRYGFTKCTTCHLSPVGGGPRNTVGKAFGLRSYSASPYGSQDVWSVEVRGLYYLPKKTSSTKGGAGVMAGNLSANLPVHVNEESKRKLRAVLSHNVGGLPGGAGSPREMYLRWELKKDSDLKPQYALLGRFVSPFGIPTDEHRTYTKLQTKSTWNDLDMGLLLSGGPDEFFHYDLAIVNGQKTSGTSMAQGNGAIWGGVLNLRLFSNSWPVAFGLSGLYYKKTSQQKHSPSAGAAYVMMNLDKLTKEWIKGSLLTEYVVATGWNGSLSNFFFTDTKYEASVANSASEGWYALLTWDFNERLSFNYKYDQFIPDRRFPADTYIRHGVGLKYYLGPNLFTLLRVEKAQATHPTEAKGTEKGSQDAAWSYLQFSI